MRPMGNEFLNLFAVKGNIRRCFGVFMLTLIASGVHGQSTSNVSNAPRFNDITEKRNVVHLNSGESGSSCIWDFSNSDISGEVFMVTNETDSLGRITTTGYSQVNYYIIRGNTLYEIGNETPLKTTTYNRPPYCMKYPIALGDSISKEYEGYGIYCGDHYFKEKGISRVVVDGHGDIILSETDTLKNVLRVYKLRAYSLVMDMNPSKIDSTQYHQVIEERYEWYIEGREWPVFEKVTSTSYVNLTPVGTTEHAYCSIPELVVANAGRVQPENNEHGEKEVQETQHDIIHYSVSADANSVDVNYSLDAESNVTMLLCNHMGMIHQSKKCTQDAGTGYNVNFDIGGLQPGVYVLYINVNGKIYNEKIRK